MLMPNRKAQLLQTEPFRSPKSSQKSKCRMR
jgi:hypothetical protein